jgi:hypothetical protein
MARRFASFSLITVLIMALASFAFAQGKKKEPAVRSVTGVVTNETGEPVPGAIVQLKNTKTLQVRSFITKEKGEYYFNDLATDVDYEFKAEWNGKSSNTRTLSTFDSHPAVIINLQLK